MPGVEVSPEHDHLVLLVASRNLGNGVVGGSTLGIRTIDDVELEFDRSAVLEDARDAAVVLVPHDHGGHGFVRIVGRVVERDNLPVFAAGIIDANQCALFDEELIDFRPELTRGNGAGLWRLLPASATLPAAALPRAGIVRIVSGLHVLVGAALRRRREAYRNKPRLANEYDRPLHL